MHVFLARSQQQYIYFRVFWPLLGRNKNICSWCSDVTANSLKKKSFKSRESREEHQPSLFVGTSLKFFGSREMYLNQDKIKNWLVLFFAELFATGILVFVGCLGCVDKFEHFQPTHLTICLSFGFAVMIAVNSFGCVSGAHINPAVTLTAIIYKLIDIPVSGECVFSLSQFRLSRASPDGGCLCNWTVRGSDAGLLAGATVDYR
jgi:hypothetical protein